MKHFYKTIFLLCLSVSVLWAGNPDRQGEAGAVELLMNPWARSAGLHTLNTAGVTGVEAMRLNIAGLSRMEFNELNVGHARYFSGTGVSLNSAGYGQKMGENGAIGVSLMFMNFGDIPVTRSDIPEGTGATFSPSFFHLGLGYSHMFENKVSVGVLVRVISETVADVSSSGVAIDAGVQYVAGDMDQIKFGISLRNLGNRMKFGGEGLAFNSQNPEVDPREVEITTVGDIQAATFQLPSVLNIGLSYDLILNTQHTVTIVGNFTSNAFSRDQIGGGIEYNFKDLFMLRGGYRYDVDNVKFQENIYDGLSAGATLQMPLGNNKLGLDYAYRTPRAFNGTHNFGLRLEL